MLVKINIKSQLIKKIIKSLLIDPLSLILVIILKFFKVIDFPVPLNSSMRKTTASGNIFTYYNSGIGSYLPIATMAEKYGLNLREDKLNILDFGCGVGRLLLHFNKVYNSNNYYACDIDDTSVDFIRKNYPNVGAYTNNYKPPLKFENSKFHMIYSLSIFSHINIEDQSLWLEELSRVTKPGGYVFLSIEGFKSLKYWLHIELGLDLKEASEKLNKNGYIFSAYKNWESISKQNKNFRNASQLVGVKSPYGIMVMNESFIYKNWNRYNFEVLDIIKGIITTRQDLVILRKKM